MDIWRVGLAVSALDGASVSRGKAWVMSLKHVLTIVSPLLGLAIGCARHQLPASNAKIVELRRALYSYMTGPGCEPIDTPDNSARMLSLLKDIEPLDSPGKINVALDVFEYYDATDNLASSYAGEVLVKYGRWTLPLVRAREATALNPDGIRELARRIEGSPQLGQPDRVRPAATAANRDR